MTRIDSSAPAFEREPSSVGPFGVVSHDDQNRSRAKYFKAKNVSLTTWVYLDSGERWPLGRSLLNLSQVEIRLMMPVEIRPTVRTIQNWESGRKVDSNALTWLERTLHERGLL